MCLSINCGLYKTKKQLKEHVEEHNKVIIITDTETGKIFSSTDIKKGETIKVTNHPINSYEAVITRMDGGFLKVR